jgi:tripartite-type tricarboxylate transporter receptor subunit TctC
MLRRLALIFAALFAVLAPAAASAQTFPVRPIKIVVPFPPGGTPDILSRVLGNAATRILGQQIVVENRPGAGGNVAMDLVARAAPDGYTLIMGTIGTCAMNPFLYSGLRFDVERDFAPVMLVGSISNVLAVHPSVPAKSVKELVALAKARPDGLTYASSGYGSSLHIAGELLKSEAGVQIRHVPYKGSQPALMDVMAGQADLMFDNMPSILPHVQSGRLRPLAVTGTKRSKALPNVPTMAESGYPGFVVTPWFGLLAPAKTPANIVLKLNQAFNEAMKDATVRQRFAEIELEPGNGMPEAYRTLIRSEAARWGKLIRDRNIKAE